MRVYRGIQGLTRVFIGLQGYTRVYKGIHRFYRGIERGFAWVYILVNDKNDPMWSEVNFYINSFILAYLGLK